MSKIVKRTIAIVVGILLVLTALPMEHIFVLASSANYLKELPKETSDWAYVGGEYYPEKDTGTIWIRGNAYNKTGFEGSHLIDTTSLNYQNAYKKLQENKDLSDTKICILYIPNCPYSKSFLPKFQMIAGEANAKVLLIDVMSYQTSSLLPYYNSVNYGVVSPTILYIKADGTLSGQTKVHSTADFVRILQEAGYSNAVDLTDGSIEVYTSEQAYEEEVIKETNRQRIANGLLPLAAYEPLNKAADIRVKELLQKIEHQRPDGTYYNSVFNEVGVDSSKYYTGENIAAGAIVATPISAVNGWMNSSGHRANILNSNYNVIGVGYLSNSNSSYTYSDYWIQLFMGNIQFESMTLDQQSISVAKEVPISDMNITATLKFKGSDEVATIPVIDEMVTGYNKSQSGEQRVTVKYGNLTAEFDVTVGTVEPVQLTNDMVTISTENLTYDGTAKTPAVTVSNATGAYTLLEGYSYTLEYTNNINAGTATVTVTGKGNYKGSVTKTFTIAPKDIGTGTIEGVNSTYEYTGKEITPIVSLKVGNKQLYETKDFDVSYSDNVGTITASSSKPATVTGTATITVTGKGNYTGTLTKTFGFTISDTFRYAAQVELVLNPIEYDSIYDRLVYIKTTQNSITYEMILKQIQNSLTKADSALKSDEEPEGTGLNRIMSYSLYPEASKRLTDYYRFYNEYELGINASEVVKEPEVTTEVINKESVSLKGLENSLTTDSEEAQLSISDFAEDVKIDPVLYDVVNTVALDIDLTIDGTKANLSTPVTITMDIPEVLQSADNLVVLHYKDGADKEPEELATFVNDDGTISFVTSSFSPYVLTNKLEQYDAVQTEIAEDDSILNFGTTEKPDAVSNIVAYRSAENTITVSWDKVSDTNVWTILGYTVTYSLNEDMSDAKTIDVDNNTTNAIISNLSTGDYYITVSTKASSAWTTEGARQSTRARVAIPQSDGSGNQGGADTTTPTVPSEDNTTTEETSSESNTTTEEASSEDNTTTESSTDSSNEGESVPSTPSEVEDYSYINWYKPENGTITASAVKAKAGETVVVTVNPDEGYKLKVITVTDEAENNVSCSFVSDNTYTFTMPASSVNISVEFVKIENSNDSDGNNNKIEIVTPENGTVTLSTTEAGVGDRVTATIEPRVGYRLKSIRILDRAGNEVAIVSSANNKYVFEMPEGGVTIETEFVEIESTDNNNQNNGTSEETMYKVTYTTPDNGFIVINKEDAKAGEEVTITVQAKEGYELKEFYILDKDGNKVAILSSENGRFVFEMPEGGVTIKTEFVEKIASGSNNQNSQGSQNTSSSQESQNNQGESANTGDSINILVPAMTTVISLLIIISLVVLKKENK